MKTKGSRRKIRTVLITLAILILVSSFLTVNPAKGQTQVNVTIDSSKTIDINTYSVGFSLDHDWVDFRYSSASKQLARDADLKLVRIVDFRSSLSPCTYWYEYSRTGSFDWSDLDALVDAIFDVGAEPLIVLGCFTGYGENPILPRGMAINPSTRLPYPESFAAYCAEWVKHFKEKGWPVRFYEIMNEAWYYFWYSWDNTNTARRRYYVELLNTVYDRMRSVDSDILMGTDSSTLRSFLDYYVNNGRGLGFLSFHKYDTGNTWESDSSIFRKADTSRFETTSTYYSPERAREIWFNARGASLPVINSETNLSWLWNGGTDPRIQKMSGAVWTALMIRACITKGVQYSLYYRFLSSKSDERRKSTGGYGFGMVNSDNDQPWYPYYVHKMIGNNLKIGDRIVSSSSSRSEVSPLAWIHGNQLNILLICETNYARAIRLSGVTGQLDYLKIDDTVWWESPRIQTGSVSASYTFTLNGYTVMLLQKEISAPPPPTPPPPTPPPPTPPSSFHDGFESGDFSEWSGTYSTSGGSTTVATSNPHHGTHHGRFTSSGTAGTERAYCYALLDQTSELYIRAYVYVERGLPLYDENDRFNFFAIRGANSQQIVASVSVQHSGGMDRWTIKSQAGTLFSSSRPSTDQWYCVEFYTRISSANGIHRLWINGQLVIGQTGLNTASEGNIDSVRFGLTFTNGVTSNIEVHGDCCAISDSYIGPETTSLFEDDFESGNFNKWSGTETTSGETMTIASYNPYNGVYHSRSYSNGGDGTERAYCYIDLDPKSELYVRAYVNVQIGLPLNYENDRFNVIALRGNSREWFPANVFVQHTGGRDRWGIKSQSGTWISASGPSVNQWYCVELYAKIDPNEGIYRLWVGGTLLIDETGLNTATEGYIDQIRFGLTYTTGITKILRVYGDLFALSTSYVGP